MLTGKPTGKPRLKWENNIRLDIGVNVRKWFDSAQNRDYWRILVNATLNLRVPHAMELLNYMHDSNSDC